MDFKFKYLLSSYLLFCLILFGNYWIWRALSYSLPIFILLVACSLLGYRIIKGKGKLLVFLLLLMLLVFSQWRSTFPTSLTVFSNDDIRLKDQRLKEYPPVYIKIGPGAIWIPVAHWFEERKEAVAASRVATNFSEVLDPNLYFFANHPRERVGVSEFGKFPYVFFPFFVVGILEAVGLRKTKGFFLSLILAILLLSLIGNKNELGPFVLFPYIVSITVFGAELLTQKTKSLFSRPK